MGIPAFYRWLVEKYPRTVVEACDEMPAMVNGVEVPVNTSSPNPNGFEFDNLYLDMNGIIHPCFHPEGLPAPSSYDEVFAYMFKYIDKIFSIVRPGKLLFLSIDGVAPRAKMNQQRSRRFRAAKEAAAQAALSNVCESVLEHVEEKSASPEQLGKMDSNVITPGTEFMDLLSSALRYYISLRLNGDPGWQGIKVIFSDAKVPGEGEHKIMSYIRLQRNLPGFDPNTRHCLYGMDADLIMLALAAHEIQFSILREDVQKQGRKNERGKEGSRARKKRLQNLKNVTEVCGSLDGYISNLNFQFFSVAILREYLSYDMTIPGLTSKPDVERLIDDFVFMCVFVGNDFLPHIPSLEISEGAIDLLMMVYKKEFNQMGGYLTNSFEINLTRVEHFIQALGSHECGIFRRRKQVQNEKDRYFQQYSKGNLASNTVKPLLPSGIGSNSTHDPGAQTSIHSGSNAVVDKKPLLPSGTGSNSSHDPGAQSSIDSGSNAVVDKKPLLPSGTGSNSSHDPGAQTSIDSGSNAVVDKINLGEEGWKERFYAEKFEAKSEDERNRIKTHTVFKYIEGICWVMRYYYDGLCSWQWFYPYHYAPFASDFNGLDQLKIDFVLGEPFKPFDQLMGVLPAASAHALPLNYRKLMTDASSPILDFYPEDCEIDMNGQRFTWQAINKLPFIDESRLLSEIAKVEHTLTDEERERNSLGSDILSIHILHPLAAKIISFYQSNEYYKTPEVASKLEIDPKLSGGMNGYVYVSGKLEVPEKVSSPISDMEMIENNKVIFVFYQCPSFHSHIPRLPEGVIMPRKTVNKHDISDSGVLWHETSTFGRVLLRRSIPNSISGPLLAKLAYLLVSKHCLTRDVTSNDRVVELDLMEPKKKKQGSKKRRRGEVGGDPMSNNIPEESGHVPNNIPQKSDDHLSSKQLKERDGDDYAGEGVVDSGILIKQGESVSQHVVGLDLMEPNLNSSNIPKKSDDLVSSKQLKERDCDDYAGEGGVESGIIMKQGESDSQHVVGLDLMEPKKKKRRSKKRRQGEVGGDPISNNIPEESEHVPNSIPQKSDDLLSSKQLEERDGDDYAGEGVVDSGILMKQGESISQHVVGLDLMEPNLISSNILEKFDNVPSNILKKSDDLVSSKQLKERDCDDYAGEGEGVVESGIIMKQGESDSQHIVGLDLMEPKKKKRKSKKRRRGEVGGDPISNISEKSEHAQNNISQKSDDIVSSKQLKERYDDDYAGEDVVDSGVLMKQGESVSQHVVGLDLMEPSLILSNIPEKSYHVPNNIPQKSDSPVSSGKLKHMDDNDFSGEGMKWTGPDDTTVVLSMTAPDCVLNNTPIKPEVGVINMVEKFDYAIHAKQGDVVQTGNLGKQVESDVVGIDLVEHKKEKRRPKKRRRGEINDDPISKNIPEKSDHVHIPQQSVGLVSSEQLKQKDGDDYAGEGEVESGILMKQGELDSQHAVGLDLMESKKKKRRRKTSRQGEVGGDPISNNIPEKSEHVPDDIPQESDGLVSLKQMDDDYAGEGKKMTEADAVVVSTAAPIKPEVGVINIFEKFDNAVPAKQGVVQSGTHGESDSERVVGLDLLEPKKKKRRSKKKRDQIDGDLIPAC